MANQASQGLLSPFLQAQRISAAKPHLTGAVLDIGSGNGALAKLCAQDKYYGFDIDAESLEAARSGHPGYRFENFLPEPKAQFDTIVALAVIEHIADPAEALCSWKGFLKDDGAMVLSTPHPSLEWAHELGSKIGIFSHDAAEEHETLLDRKAMDNLLPGTGLRLAGYKRFLGGANQLFLLCKRQR